MARMFVIYLCYIRYPKVLEPYMQFAVIIVDGHVIGCGLVNCVDCVNCF